MIQRMESLIHGKRILLLGFGREGQSTFHFLTGIGGYEKLDIADQAALTEAMKQVIGESAWIGGSEYQDVLDNYDIVFKSPGIVLKKDITEYRCKIVSQTEVFFQCFRNQIVGITGTKGKSTTTSLLYHVLKSAGRPAMIAGNIGIPALDRVQDVKEDTIIVFELSSHQLEYMTVSPHIGVLVNIHEEHLDHYGTMEKYVEAKKHIFYNQKPEDMLFCNVQCLPEEGECRARIVPVVHENDADSSGLVIKGGCISYKNHSFQIPTEEIQLMGQHNFFDIGIAYAICKEYGLTDEEFEAGLKTYEPLPHRLRLLGEKDGVKYYDDSISTICDTTIQALKTLKDADTVLIGGMDRGIDYQELISFLGNHRIPNIILMEATGKRIFDEIYKDYPDFRQKDRLILVSHLEEAVKKAKEVTGQGRSCVLSPAAASYGIFKNFEERGDAFRRLVFEN